MICCVCWFVLLDLVVLVLVWCDDSQCSSTPHHHTSHIYTFSGPRSPSQPAPNTFSVTRLSCPCQSILGSRPVKTYRITAHIAALVTLSHSRDMLQL